MPKAVHLPTLTHEPDQVKSDLDHSGVAFHADFLTPKQTAVLRDRVLEQAELEVEQGVAETSATGTASELRFGADDAEAARFQAVSFLPNKGRVFIDFMKDPRLLDYCRHVFRDVPFYLAGQTGTIVRNGAAGQVIHTDQQAWPFLTPMPVMFNCALALSDFTPEMGSTRFVPMTQHGPPPHIGFDGTGKVTNLEPVETAAQTLKAGSIALWDARLWHGQGESSCDNERIAIITTYVMHMVRAQDNYSALLHDEVLASLDDEERALLGFEVHFDYAGRIAPRSPDDRRSNLNYVYPYVPELRRESSARAVPRPDMRIGRTKVQAQIIERTLIA